MEQQIQYCTTDDGVRIAYTITGRGEQWLVHTNNLLTATLQFPAIPGRPNWNHQLEAHYRLVRYDPRGTGLSQRDVDDLSLQGLVRDLAAVIDATGLEETVIFGLLIGTFVAVWYAADHPERVSHLALWPPPIVRADTPQFRAGAELAASDWVAFTEYFAHTALGWDQGHDANAYARSMRETISRETFVRSMTEWFTTWANRIDDVYEPASRVSAPALCMQREDYGEFPRFVAPLQHGTMRMFPGRGIVPYQDRGDEIARAIAEFTGAASPSARAVEADAGRRVPQDEGDTAIILFLDIADSTALTERMGDTAFRGAARALDERLRSAIGSGGGLVVEGKTLGDGVLATFTSAREAIAAARRCSEISGESELRLHIGIHAGDVIREPGNVYGGAVNIASRISGESAPGEVLVSATVRELARTSAGVTFEDRGAREMKGIADPLQLFAVRWDA